MRFPPTSVMGSTAVALSAVVLLSVRPAHAQAPTSGLMGHWTLDDAAGSTFAADSSGNGNNALCGWDCPTFGAAGTVGASASFDGGDDYVEVANTISNSFTIAAWVKTTDWGGGWGPAYSGHGVIWADVGGSGPDMIPMAIVNGNLAFGTGENCPNYTYDTLTSTTPVNTGQWIHLTVTRDVATGAKQMYVNGALNAANTNGGNCPLNYNYYGAIAFGANWLDNRFFAGQLDDVYFYNRVLSATEIQSFLSPQSRLSNLASAVNALVTAAVLNAGTANALTAKLNAALQQITAGNTTAAANQLGAFVNQVRALVNSHRLTDAQAQPLIDAASGIAASLQ